MSLALDKLENVVEDAQGWQARCPACAEDDRDKTGNHLRIWRDENDEAKPGKFSCVVNQGADGEEHRKRIYKLAGGKGGKRVRPRLTAEARARRKRDEELQKLSVEMAVLRHSIIAEYAWSKEQIDAETAPLPKDARGHWEAFLGLWQPEDVLWCGRRKDSEVFFKTPEQFKAAGLPEEFGIDHTTGYCWQPGSRQRIKANLGERRFLVVEHDEVSVVSQLAFIRWIREGLGLTLRALVHTGGKSIHAWFDAPAEPAMPEILAILGGLGIDRQSLLRSATRIPGAIRQPDPDKPEKPHGQLQRFVFINPSLS